jgi:hypothetical protein
LNERGAGRTELRRGTEPGSHNDLVPDLWQGGW